MSLNEDQKTSIGPKDLEEAKKLNPDLELGLKNCVFWTNDPTYLQKPDERVIKGEGNSALVFGRDSPNGLGTGTAAVGTTNSAAIEIVVGRGTAVKDQQPPKDAYVDSNTYADAAKIYISENTNIDKAFNYRGMIKNNTLYQSAVAIKADQVRLFSRGDIILSTGMDQIPKEDVYKDAKFAPQHSVRDHSGISLVANNNTIDLQPLVKGNNLVNFLNKTSNSIIQLHSIIQKFILYQSELNRHIANHVHKSEFNAEDGYMSFGLKAQIEIFDQIISHDCSSKLKDSVNVITSDKNNYLSEGKVKYINSTYNKTN
jgi:hypothetical protein